MTLRNAFESVATDSLVRRLLQAINFARDANDRLRVVVDSGTISNIQAIGWGSNTGQPSYYGAGSPNSMDMRDMYRVALRANVIQARQHRWTFV